MASYSRDQVRVWIGPGTDSISESPENWDRIKMVNPDIKQRLIKVNQENNSSEDQSMPCSMPWQVRQ